MPPENRIVVFAGNLQGMPNHTCSCDRRIQSRISYRRAAIESQGIVFYAQGLAATYVRHFFFTTFQCDP
jgi:hypothetical protein